MKKLIIFFLIICSFTGICAQEKPETVEQAVSILEIKWSTEEKEDYKKIPEAEATGNLHMTVGMTIRNSWLRHGNDSLKNQLIQLGIKDYDSMSDIILRSFHRKLNNIPIDLEGQVNYIKAEEKAGNECSVLESEIALYENDVFTIGDKITIQMRINTSDGTKNAVLLDCGDRNNWSFNPDKDLEIEAEILSKFYVYRKSNIFFKVKILKLSKPEIKILKKDVTIGDNYDFNLISLYIKLQQ